MHGLTEKITSLLSDYAHCIDSDELERWPGFFTKQARYFVTTAFNQEKGLSIGIIDASSRNMFEDRVAALRRTNI